MRQVMGDFVDTLITKPEGGERFVRIMLRSQEQSEAIQKEELIALVRKTVEETIRSQPWQTAFENGGKKNDKTNEANRASKHATVSGYYVLLAELVSSIVADQWRCFAAATIGIWIAMSIAVRSSWFAFLAILPNALPSLCILGWMGWMGTRVNLGAAMIAAVSMGLSVDSSLHYLTRFRRARVEGFDFLGALREAQLDIGMSILLSTIVLVVGFGSLGMSDFLPTVVFGTTAAISMLGGLLGNLFLLPAMLMMAGEENLLSNFILGWTVKRR